MEYTNHRICFPALAKGPPPRKTLSDAASDTTRDIDSDKSPLTKTAPSNHISDGVCEHGILMLKLPASAPTTQKDIDLSALSRTLYAQFHISRNRSPPYWSIKTATSCLSELRIMFPGVKSSNTLLAMGACYALHITVKHDTQRMTAMLAKQALSESIAILVPTVPCKGGHAATYKDEAQRAQAERMRTVTKIFVRHVRKTLSAQAYIKLAQRMVDVLAAWAEEKALRERTACATKELYLHVRAEKEGLQPLFCLLESDIYPQGFRDTEPTSSALKKLAANICLVVTLQRDIGAVQRGDLLATDGNMAVVLGGGKIEDGLAQTVKLHNAAVQDAVARWREVKEIGPRSDERDRYADGLLRIISRRPGWKEVNDVLAGLDALALEDAAK